MAFASDKEALDALRGKHAQLTAEIRKVIVGQEEVVEQVLVSVFSGGHCLLVGVPGLAKTLLVNTIAQALGLAVQADTPRFGASIDERRRVAPRKHAT